MLAFHNLILKFFRKNFIPISKNKNPNAPPKVLFKISSTAKRPNPKMLCISSIESDVKAEITVVIQNEFNFVNVKGNKNPIGTNINTFKIKFLHSRKSGDLIADRYEANKLNFIGEYVKVPTPL